MCPATPGYCLPDPFGLLSPIGLFPSFTFLSRTLWTIDCFLAIISGSPSQFTNPALPSWKNIQGAPVASCKRPLSHGKYLESRPHTRKARPAHRLRELTFTPNHLRSAQPDRRPPHRDTLDLTAPNWSHMGHLGSTDTAERQSHQPLGIIQTSWAADGPRKKGDFERI